MAEQEVAPQTAPAKVSPPALAADAVQMGLLGGAKLWILHEGPWWACSFVFHLTLVCSLALVSSKVVEKVVDEAPSFEEVNVPRTAEVPQQIERFEVSQTPEDPTELTNETLSLEKPAQMTQDEKHYDDSSKVVEQGGGGTPMATGQPNLGGLGGFDLQGIGAGPAVRGKGGVGGGLGTGIHAGSGGDDVGFGTRTGHRKAMLGSGGGTRQSERAVAGALNWLARHQSRDGSWSLTSYKANCKDPSCSGDAKIGSYEPAATALALLPFLGAGQTHKSGLYRKTVYAGITYLVRNQKLDGDLRMGQTMYAHGLAAIALCECYGISGDKQLKNAAQAALSFIMQAQDPAGGGWRYGPREPGDTSVTGWQVMALKSGQMAYLAVSPVVFERAKGFLKLCSSGKHGGLFSYMPAGQTTGDIRAVTAVSLLCHQYMHMPRTDPAMIEGTTLLMQNLPDPNVRNIYYWYYGTQVMHNQPGPDWDTWNRKMRRTLIDAQCKENNCAAGSWDPVKPQPDAWGAQGGRLMMTSLSALTLEVYYRYLPLYKIEEGAVVAPVRAADNAAAKPTEKPAAKPASKPAEKAATKPVEKPADKPAAKDNGKK
jgi:hypothetical protein